MTMLGQVLDREAPASAGRTIDWRLDPEAHYKAYERHRQKVERYLN